jgi:hypothetical protein
VKDANGKVTVLPNNPEQTSNPVTTNATYILAGFWSDGSGTKLKFIDGDGSTVFDLELLNTKTGITGTLTSQVPGLVVQGAIVTCND